jgi:hypothetical protein
MTLADDPHVQEALRTALDAGVPQSDIDWAFQQAVALPLDPLTEPILTGSLYALARRREQPERPPFVMRTDDELFQATNVPPPSAPE